MARNLEGGDAGTSKSTVPSEWNSNSMTGLTERDREWLTASIPNRRHKQGTCPQQDLSIPSGHK